MSETNADTNAVLALARAVKNRPVSRDELADLWRRGWWRNGKPTAEGVRAVCLYVATASPDFIP